MPHILALLVLAAIALPCLAANIPCRSGQHCRDSQQTGVVDLTSSQLSVVPEIPQTEAIQKARTSPKTLQNGKKPAANQVPGTASHLLCKVSSAPNLGRKTSAKEKNPTKGKSGVYGYVSASAPTLSLSHAAARRAGEPHPPSVNTPASRLTEPEYIVLASYCKMVDEFRRTNDLETVGSFATKTLSAQNVYNLSNAINSLLPEVYKSFSLFTLIEPINPKHTPLARRLKLLAGATILYSFASSDPRKYTYLASHLATYRSVLKTVCTHGKTLEPKELENIISLVQSTFASDPIVGSNQGHQSHNTSKLIMSVLHAAQVHTPEEVMHIVNMPQ